MSVLNDLSSALLDLLTKITSDDSMFVAIAIEALVLTLKVLIGDKHLILSRLSTQVIDAPTDFMTIVLGYTSALLIIRDNNRVFLLCFWAALIIGMMVTYYLCGLLQEILQVNKGINPFNILKFALFFIASYAIPYLSLKYALSINSITLQESIMPKAILFAIHAR